MIGRNPHNSRFGIDEFGGVHFCGHPHGSHTIAFTHPALKHKEFTFFNGKFEVLHVFIVGFQSLLIGVKFFVEFGHNFLHGRKVFALVIGRISIDRSRCADTCHNVFALGIDQKFTIEFIFTIARISGKGHPCCAVVAHITENHCLYVDSGSPLVGYSFYLSVFNGSFAIPAREYGTNATPHLFHGIFREGLAQSFFNGGFKISYQFFEVGCRDLVIAGIAFGSAKLFEFFIEEFSDAFSVFGFNAGCFFHHHIGIHHDESAIGIVGKSFVASGCIDQTLDIVFIEAYVEHGFHHARHGFAGTTADGYQQWIFGSPILSTHDALHLADGCLYLCIEGYRVFVFVLVVIGTNLGGDRKARRNGQFEVGVPCHFSQVGAFTP